MIQAPETCPSCSSTLEWTNDSLYCRNFDCPAKSLKQIEHFAKTLKIKGMGPSTIEKLDIYDIAEIFTLTVDYMTEFLGSERTALKLFTEIEHSKTEPLNVLLPAFGIPLVGKSATDKLALVCESIFDIDVFTCKNAGLGPKVTENLMGWINDKFDTYCDLPFSYEFSKNTKPISDKVICITGKLVSFKTKAEATSVLEQLGYAVKSSLTKDVNLLVNESGVDTAKTLKFADTGGLIITNLKEYLENKE